MNEDQESVVVRACIPVSVWKPAPVLRHQIPAVLRPIDMPDIPRSKRPATVEFQKHLLPAFLEAERPFSCASFAKWLSCLTYKPPSWLNAFLTHSRMSDALTVQRSEKGMFEDPAPLPPMVGLPQASFKEIPGTRSMRLPLKLHVSPMLGDHCIMVDRPSDMEYVLTRLIVYWWQHDENGSLRYGSVPFRLARAQFTDSPEAVLPFSMTRATFAVLRERPPTA